MPPVGSSPGLRPAPAGTSSRAFPIHSVAMREDKTSHGRAAAADSHRFPLAFGQNIHNRTGQQKNPGPSEEDPGVSRYQSALRLLGTTANSISHSVVPFRD